MSTPAPYIGAVADIFVPDDTEQIALGYTGIRVYWATSETAAASLATTLTLVAAQRDYSYNKTDALSSDWFEWCLYGATPGEGPRSERVPVGPPSITRKQVRQEVGRRLNLVEVVTATGTSGTVFTAPELIDPDRSVHDIANRWARPTAGDYLGNTRRVRAGSTGYSNTATGEVTVGRTFGGTLAASTEVELWKPRGDVDPSARVDEAMQRARLQLWWTETWYLTTDANVSDYYLPQTIQKAAVVSIDWASDDYPERPGWVPVGWWNIVQEGQLPLLTVLASAEGHMTYASQKVIRIVYNRVGDRMDSDTDTWSVPLEWATAEASFEYVKGQIVPGGNKENMDDLVRSGKVLEAECIGYRAAYMPQAPNPHMREAR